MWRLSKLHSLHSTSRSKRNKKYAGTRNYHLVLRWMLSRSMMIIENKTLTFLCIDACVHNLQVEASLILCT